MRDLTPNVQAEVVKPTVRLGFLFALRTTPPILLWTGAAPLVWNGETFQPVGTFGGVAGISESESNMTNRFTCSLSGIPNAYVAALLSEKIRGLDVQVWLAFFTDAWALIPDPVEFSGIAGNPVVTEIGDTSTISIEVSSPMVAFTQPLGTKWTDAEQQRRYPGDKFFEYVAGLSGKRLAWGTTENTGATHIDDSGDYEDYYE